MADNILSPDKNGKPATVTTIVTPKPEDKKPDEKKPEKPEKPKKEKEEVNELPPIEDRILIIEKLFDLIEKREAIKESVKKIESFKTSSDSNRDDLKLSDSKGNVFQTSNSAVIKDVIEVIKNTLKLKLAEVEKQIKF